MINLYSFFHLNLAYSAIEEEDRPCVIKQCYWPLLRLARKRNLPFGIELSGYTLEVIRAWDPGWVEELTSLVKDGPCELIGCGYAQVIGPLVPHEVTSANLRIGHAVYEQILGVRPRIALINEQAYSSGLVHLYKEAGYEAFIMEWNNPAREHSEWDAEWRYLPQRAQGTPDSEIDLIWNKSISFQKFQRYAHGEIDLDEILGYVRSHQTDHLRAFPVYGNDVEIFDFRPGRYMTEARINNDGEWRRIDDFYAALQQEPGMTFIRPSQVLELKAEPGANHLLDLSSPAQPVPVKKQDKYNVVRWAVTGRDDLGINTRCWQIFEALKLSSEATDADWRELCYLWSSDFRTHITEKRWAQYQERLTRLEGRWSPQDSAPKISAEDVGPDRSMRVERTGRWLMVHGQRLSVSLNCLRGLALDTFTDHAISDHPLCGTLHHGYFDDIKLGADFYSGHLVFESPGRHKVTDLSPVEPSIVETALGLIVSTTIDTPLGPIKKRWLIEDHTGRLSLTVTLDWQKPVIGSLRLGHLTLLPEAFDAQRLSYATHNGGALQEKFVIPAQRAFDHGTPVSFLVSAGQALGLTNGEISLGDERIQLQMQVDKCQSAVVGMVSHSPTQDRFLTRLILSAREMDDTSTAASVDGFTCCFTISACGVGTGLSR